MANTYIEDLVSVIIPTYNVENYITETVQSVLLQTYQNFEILIIDDCSKDNTRTVVETLAEKDARIKCIWQDKNMGAAEARNRGLREACGQYIAFLDSDDLWVKDKLQKQIDDIRKNGVVFSYTAYDFINENSVKVKDSIKIKRQLKYRDLLTKTMIATPTVVIDRNKTGDVLMPLRRTGQDYAFWMLLLRKHHAYGIQEPLAHVRKRQGSLSKNKLQNIRDVWEVQTINEGIHKLAAGIHVIGYCIYTVKKRILR